MTLNYPDIAGSAGTNDSSLQWKKIWDLGVVPKIKQFMWRLAHNSLPLKMNIKRRGIECNTLCVCCGRLDEDGAHLFLKCKEVKKAWKLIGLEEQCDRMSAYSTAESVVQEILGLKDTARILACCMLWRWWIGRNNLNSEGKKLSVESVVGQARYWAAESTQYCNANRKGSSSSCTTMRQSQWIPPDGDRLKINCDGAFAAETSTGGWGFVIRDHDGTVRGSGAGQIAHAASAAMAEAQACQEAVQAAATWGMGHLHIEADALNLIKALQDTSLDRTPEGVIYRDIRAFMRLNFISICFSHCPRTCNNLAHELAALGARHQVVRSLWLEALPVDVFVPVTSNFAESTS
jgi:ribonuclease HI